MYQYDPKRFAVANLAEAKSVILAPDDNLSTEDRWQRETPYVIGLIRAHSADRGPVLDYGCGIGRIAKPLTEDGCVVVGVDNSYTMLRLAMGYVAHRRFGVCSPRVLREIKPQFCSAIAIWTLQHCARLTEVVDDLVMCLHDHGRLFVLNLRQRALPIVEGGWYDDEESLDEALGKYFVKGAHGKLSPAVATENLIQQSFWAVYEKL